MLGLISTSSSSFSIPIILRLLFSHEVNFKQYINKILKAPLHLFFPSFHLVYPLSIQKKLSESLIDRILTMVFETLHHEKDISATLVNNLIKEFYEPNRE